MSFFCLTFRVCNVQPCILLHANCANALYFYVSQSVAFGLPSTAYSAGGVLTMVRSPNDPDGLLCMGNTLKGLSLRSGPSFCRSSIWASPSSSACASTWAIGPRCRFREYDLVHMVN